MLICPNCDHENPEGATLCETCYTPLPINTQCPNCGASMLDNATFCGQCGYIINENISEVEMIEETIMESPLENEGKPILNVIEQSEINLAKESEEELLSNLEGDLEEVNLSSPIPINQEKNTPTQLQIQKANLLHVQTSKQIELPSYLSVIHLGKENDQIPPDIDVSGFPDSQFVSRIHANIRVEGDGFYIEDVGSANGTFINHIPLPRGNRHLLRAGDRIALGKEDKVSFIFQIPS